MKSRRKIPRSKDFVSYGESPQDYQTCRGRATLHVGACETNLVFRRAKMGAHLCGGHGFSRDITTAASRVSFDQ
jgi:hypothetical protein